MFEHFIIGAIIVGFMLMLLTFRAGIGDLVYATTQNWKALVLLLAVMACFAAGLYYALPSLT